ncbi:ABC transporter A family member 2 [Glycine max]|uniref:uncharacterized protein LOC114419027 n=1 Tax=Glycine soja TaxID=3848 RepID=UPI0010399346|nr:uncharacterized protein LOC114419027 [Glycine soja]KAH1241235.1 ABC transporter A family member 2 [Glycine max]
MATQLLHRYPLHLIWMLIFSSARNAWREPIATLHLLHHESVRKSILYFLIPSYWMGKGGQKVKEGGVLLMQMLLFRYVALQRHILEHVALVAALNVKELKAIIVGPRDELEKPVDMNDWSGTLICPWTCSYIIM